jgi:hypothetical protein
LKLAIFAKALKKAVAANARLLASLLVKQAAVLLISSAKTKKANKQTINAAKAAFFHKEYI